MRKAKRGKYPVKVVWNSGKTEWHFFDGSIDAYKFRDKMNNLVTCKAEVIQLA